MRYIEKSDTEPKCLADYKRECAEYGVPKPWLYKDFNRTSELREVLSLEQHNVCCYCQRAVKAFRTEHLYPENGADKKKSEDLQLDYYNVYAACIDSQGRQKSLQCCDVAKGNEIIREFIKEPQCQTHFRYLSTGEIVPNGQFYTLREYEEATSLSEDETDALRAIKVLNLNCSTLREDRKQCIDALLSLLPRKSKEDWKQAVNTWLCRESFPDYIELRIQYINRYINAC